MNTTSMKRTWRLEESLAVLLRYGSWLASATIGLGFALALCDSRFGTQNLALLPNMRIAAIGIVLFILLPALRVLLMLLVFIRQGDFRLAATAGLVFAMIVLGIFLGLRTASGSCKSISAPSNSATGSFAAPGTSRTGRFDCWRNNRLDASWSIEPIF